MSPIEADTRALPSAYSSFGNVFDVRAQSRLISWLRQLDTLRRAT